MLKNENVNIKIKLSFLWTSLMFFYIYNDYFELYVPEKIEQITKGTSVLNSPTSIFVASIVMSIPALMIVSSLFIRPTISKWMNIIFGIVFIIIISSIAVSSLSKWYIGYLFYSFIEILISGGIVWTAWNWPRNNIEA